MVQVIDMLFIIVAVVVYLGIGVLVAGKRSVVRDPALGLSIMLAWPLVVLVSLGLIVLLGMH